MKVPPHVISLYLKTARKYRKLVSRIHRQGITPYQRHTFSQRLQKLLRKLKGLRLQLRIAAATGSVILFLNQTPASAQVSPLPDGPVLTPNPLGPFVKQDRITNPLREPIFTRRETAITAVDFDGDGDLDVVASDYDYYGGTLRYFENQSAAGHPVYIERIGQDNPFNGIHALTENASPALADIDEDGDLDLFIGQGGNFVQYQPYYNYARGIEYYRNDAGTFSVQTGPWDATTRQGNPFEGLQLGNSVAPVFVDFDHDGDLDLVAGSRTNTQFPYYIEKFVHYYQNDGSGNFTPSELTLDTQPNYYWSDRFFPSLADVDNDGDFDMVIGTFYDGYIRYYKQDTPGNFIEQTEAWNAEAKTGNPFFELMVGQHVSPAFLDFDGDGHIDLFVADEPGWNLGKYSDNIINYYRNSGNGSFDRKEDFDNPFGGIFVKSEASPVLMDIDGDSDIDAVIGNKYSGGYYDYNTGQYIPLYSYLSTYRQKDGKFVKSSPDDDPFKGLSVDGLFSPQFADVDGDGDPDIISGNYAGEVMFFRNDGGTYHHETVANPFSAVNVVYSSSARLVDIDNDKDLDLFVTNDWNEIHYFENTGDATNPAFTERTGTDNPLSGASEYMSGAAFLRFDDIDHDGDFDILFNGVNTFNREGNTIQFIENTGTADAPVFDTYDPTLFEDHREDAKVFTIDYDGDGDLDVFAGNYDGTVSYLKNENPAVDVTLNAGAVQYEHGTAPVLLAPDIALADTDNDVITRAVVKIDNYLPGEKLDFTPQTGITGIFDSGTGTLTFRGQATITAYQTILRTITFEAHYESGRRRPGEKTIIEKSVSYAVFDQDLTTPNTQAVRVDVFVNDPPAIGDATINLTIGGSATLDLKSLISDPNGASDLDQNSLKVTQDPSSGAVVTIDGNGILTVDYNTLVFTGQETIGIEVCDLRGSCAEQLITVVVTNSPPVITPEPVLAPAGTVKSINLMSITTDVDGNLDPAAFSIVREPLSKAKASIEPGSSGEVNLALNYEGITYHGTDEITIRACDRAGACSESLVAVVVDVEGSITVYNAVAPNSSGDNRFMRITGLPEKNKVSIFNRWGDKVFEVQDYVSDPSGNAFRGLNDSGAALPSGTYFYAIEIPGKRTITGYLTLKQ